jgi:hypothetical protein
VEKEKEHDKAVAEAVKEAEDKVKASAAREMMELQLQVRCDYYPT